MNVLSPVMTNGTQRRPTVAIVGRMNVGKSTLFNRLTQSRRAITSDWAGTTRDVLHASVIWRGSEFAIVDTGGLDVEDDEQLEDRVIAAARRAVTEADLVLFVIDGQTGVLPQDKRLAREMRNTGKPAVLVVNKIDSERKESNVDPEIYRLQLEPVCFVSASNGRATGDLLDTIYEMLNGDVQPVAPERRTHVAIIGRPNVGKSSMLNSILGDERVIVADKAHTTRDINDIPYEYKDHKFMLIDTAGIRRRTKVGRWNDKRLMMIEKQSVQAAIHTIERADVVILVLEANKRVNAQDKKITLLADKHSKGMIIAVNKWDVIEEKTSTTINEFSEYFDAALPFLRWAPMVFISAKEHVRVRELLDVVVQVTQNYERRLHEEDVETIFRITRGQYRPPQGRRKKFEQRHAKLLGLEQIAIRPPRFRLLVDRPKDVPPAIPKIIERELRDRFDFDGVKIIIEIAKKERRADAV